MRLLCSSEPGFPSPEAWDALIARDPNGHLLQTWAWGSLKGEFGWQPVRLAVERDGALVAGAQVLWRRLGPLRLGYIPRGPAFPEPDDAAQRALWQGIEGLARRARAVALLVEPNWPDGAPEAEALAAHGLRPSPDTVQPRRTIVVDLDASEQEILARMKSKWRYNVRLAARRGVEVRPVGLEGLDAFYALLRLTGRRDGFAIHSAAYYRRALDLLAPLGRAELFLAHHEGEPLAGLMAMAFGPMAIYMYGASSNARRELMPNHLLQWWAMQWARGLGCAYYDLWGIADVEASSPTAALRGVQRFKEGFGGRVVRTVGAYQRVYAPALHWLLRQGWALRRRLSSAKSETPSSA